MTRGKMVEVTCNNPNCKCRFMARVADRARGWAQSCSKKCAATMTNKKTGNFKEFLRKRNYAEEKENEVIASMYDFN